MSVVTVHLKPPLESKLCSRCQCLMEHTRHQQVYARTLLWKNLLLFKWHICAFCGRLYLKWVQPPPAGGFSPFGLFTWTLPALVCVTNTFDEMLVTLEPTWFGHVGSSVQLPCSAPLFINSKFVSPEFIFYSAPQWFRKGAIIYFCSHVVPYFLLWKHPWWLSAYKCEGCLGND